MAERTNPLLPRDVEVLMMLGQGMRPQQIGREWNRTASAIMNRIARVTTKLGTRTTAQTVLEAYRHRLFALPDDPPVGLVRATAAAPHRLWWRHECGAMRSFHRDAPPTDGCCVACYSTSPDLATWQPVWVSAGRVDAPSSEAADGG
ncbi:MAG TPA: hypothetical protein VJ914_40315 [Pseudonocardiaceae bacterium]|nr:hypothetical protein [Pseudonocardiaceae bacterium]